VAGPLEVLRTATLFFLGR